MEKVFKVFNSSAHADEEDRKFYLGLTPNQRIEILLELIFNYSDTYYNDSPKGLQRIYRIIDREQS